MTVFRKAFWNNRDLAWTAPTRIFRRILLYVVISSGAAILLVPFLWMISTSLKGMTQLYVWPPAWIPDPIKWENYPNAWEQLPWLTYYKNTMVITSLCILGILCSCSIAAYGFSRLRFPGRDIIFFLLLTTMMLPGQVTMIPLYIMFAKLGWVNTFKPLIVPSWFGNAFLIFLLRQFFMTISRELDDAARIDGCGFLGVFWHILLPLSKPALGIAVVFTFTWNWNDFLQPLIYLQSMSKFTVQLGLTFYKTPTFHDVAATMAMSVVALIPQLIVFFIAQRYFVRGIALTGIKG
jgi:multiple sugar transport system permease protein